MFEEVVKNNYVVNIYYLLSLSLRVFFSSSFDPWNLQQWQLLFYDGSAFRFTVCHFYFVEINTFYTFKFIFL